MPSSKSSTLTDTCPINPIYMEWAARDDYKAMLDELLAVIHLDGGQYTLLTGYACSLEDAVTRVVGVRKELVRLQHKEKRNASKEGKEPRDG